jgi:hypothetical protein
MARMTKEIVHHTALTIGQVSISVCSFVFLVLFAAHE